jgi:thiaminase/transcriptional activator TenA
MPARSLSGEFREANAPLWDAIMTHPFVRGIGSGRLSRDRFVHYLSQDYVYLTEFSRVLALASAKSSELSDMRYLADLLHATLAVEMDLHRRTCADFGIDRGSLERAEPALVTTAYAGMLVRTCYEGTLGDILAALLPCEVGYAEIAESLKRKGLPKNPHYRDWIETYSSPEFRGFADWVAGKFDEHSKERSAHDVERWRRLYVTSARFELLFFEMSWRRENWPGVIPADAAHRTRKGA